MPSKQSHYFQSWAYRKDRETASQSCMPKRSQKSFEIDSPLATTKGGLPRLGQMGRELTTTMGNCSGQQRILLPFGQQSSPSPCPNASTAKGGGAHHPHGGDASEPPSPGTQGVQPPLVPPGPECPLSWPGWGTGASAATCGGTHGPSAGSPLTRAPRAVPAPGGHHAGAL